MDLNQTNENELQKAIDDITKNAAAPANDSSGMAAELEAKIQNQMGVPPAPPVVPGDGEFVVPNDANAAPVSPAPATDSMVGAEANEVTDLSASVTETAGTTEAVAQPEVATQEAVVESKVEISSDLEKVKESMLKDLFPLMDKINVMPEQKFKIYKQMIESTQDKSMIVAAYEAVKGIADETTKAEALLYLVEQAD